MPNFETHTLSAACDPAGPTMRYAARDDANPASGGLIAQRVSSGGRAMAQDAAPEPAPTLADVFAQHAATAERTVDLQDRLDRIAAHLSGPVPLPSGCGAPPPDGAINGLHSQAQGIAARVADCHRAAERIERALGLAKCATIQRVIDAARDAQTEPNRSTK